MLELANKGYLLGIGLLIDPVWGSDLLYSLLYASVQVINFVLG